MHIAFNTDELSEMDLRVLRAVLGDDAPTPAPEKAQESPSPATKKAAAPKTPRKPAKAAEAPPVDEETPSEPQEEQDGPDEALLAEAVERATHLIRVEKRGAEVKAALEKVGEIGRAHV